MAHYRQSKRRTAGFLSTLLGQPCCCSPLAAKSNVRKFPIMSVKCVCRIVLLLASSLIALGSLCETAFAFEDSATLLEFSVTPAATGQQLVRTSVPFRSGVMQQDTQIVADDGHEQISVAVRPLGFHVDSKNQRTVRQAMITFPYQFLKSSPIVFRLHAAKRSEISHPKPNVYVTFHSEGWWKIDYSTGKSFRADPIWPGSEPTTDWQHEIVEQNPYFTWERWKQQSDNWQRVVEFRSDHLGQVVAVAHLQRTGAGSNWAPRFGWEIAPIENPEENTEHSDQVIEIEQLWKLNHSFTAGGKFESMVLPGRIFLTYPAAPCKRCGAVFTRQFDSRATAIRYLRSTPSDRVPMQQFAWRRAEFVLSPEGISPVDALFLSSHQVAMDWRAWHSSYDVGPPVEVEEVPLLMRVVDFHHQAIIQSAAVGPDWGNVTSYSEDSEHGDIFGMNRLNHAPEIFFGGMRTGNRELMEIALAWCDNFHDLTIWWGPDGFGGTRYNNLRKSGHPIPNDDTTYMWRGEESTTFCTKGYAAFQIAYELTGDPRMQEALEAQVAYAAENVHSNEGECRNIGDVADFVKLYELTGEQRFLDQGLRLFRELRPLLSTDHLFDQGGKSIEGTVLYIDDDAHGYETGYAKPYIIGYGLAGCPRLAEYFPNEPELQEMVRAIADFLVESQETLGGWRYPHPASSRTILGQAIEHANQLAQACQLLGPREEYLDAIERVLRQRILLLDATGKFANNLFGWEVSTGLIENPLQIYDLYEAPSDRDPSRDYREGQLQLGTATPEGLIYFPAVLKYYLDHRSLFRLLKPPAAESPLGQLIAANSHDKVSATKSQRPLARQSIGVNELLPVFYQELAKEMKFPLAWENATGSTFELWKTHARRRVREAFLTSPTIVDFDPKVIDSQQRDGYTAQKIEFNLSGESRVLAYLLIPVGKGPFPAVLLLHDHGAEFRIGKEKLVRAWDISGKKQEFAAKWVEKYYGGRFLGDELAKRGYVCLVTDALNWSDRGGGGFEGQQALSSNLMHFGRSLAGLIAHEDIRAAEFLASQPEVDSDRVAALGLSMGAFRTWQVAAMSDHIAAGAAICWMATVKGLMQPGNNQTKGQSAYTMLHPGLLNLMDYPDIASLACPKPMLFYNGLRDDLFPVPSVEEAYEKLRSVWKSQRHEDLLETRLWDVPHEFNVEMQDAAFGWLDQQLGINK